MGLEDFVEEVVDAVDGQEYVFPHNQRSLLQFPMLQPDLGHLLLCQMAIHTHITSTSPDPPAHVSLRVIG